MPSSPLAGLKAFAATRNGKIALGGGGVGTVVVAGLARRRGAKGDPTAPGAASSSAPPFSVAPATGTSGTNLDAFPTINTPGIDVGQFEQLLSDLGRIADTADQRAYTTPTPTAAPNPAPAAAPPAPVAAVAAAQPTIYTVVSGDTLSRIAARFGLSSWRLIYDANKGIIGGNPNLIRPGQRLTIPGR